MQYPNNIKKNATKLHIAYGNRGMDLENAINETNDYYRDHDIAFIYKKPTPINVVKVGYENGIKKITNAFFKEPSTLDYNGIYKGFYIEFEAKETTNKTSFPLANIHKHQIKHIENVLKHGGIAFIIIKINAYTYLLNGKDFLDYISKEKRKSITYNYIEEKGYKIKEAYQPRLDYLKVVDELIKGGYYGKES